MSHSIERMPNIENMTKKLKQKIQLFEAISGKNVDVIDLSIYDKNLVYRPQLNDRHKFKFNTEIACFLSHFMLIKSLLQSTSKYAVIFEDDFLILDNHCHQKIKETLANIDEDFDILYLGHRLSSGIHYKDNIFFPPKNVPLYGTHGYVVNIENIQKIYDILLFIELPIDMQYTQLIHTGKLHGLISLPILIDTGNFHSTIVKSLISDPQKINQSKKRGLLYTY